ncbi:MAG: glycerol-3-phosphate 1-O-acyltransferase PlsY [Pseudomonadota bacterium]
MWGWLLVPLAYVLGSLSSAIIVCRVMNLPDPREQGSKNPGATNVLRFGGKKAAAITLLGDLMKGLLPVLLAIAVGGGPMLLACVGLAAFAGHLYPIFFGFRGGKGVATAFGVFLGISWQVGLALLVTWLTMARIFHISSLSALTAALLAPVYVWWLNGAPELIAASLVVSAVLIWRHKSNIQDLLAGNEDRIRR